MAHRYISVSQRFWNNVHKTAGCWLWTGLKTRDGYGRIRVNGKQTTAHRLSYLLHHGDPAGRCVMHACDNPACVNPDHLLLGTVTDNNADRHAKGRDARGDKNGSRLYPERRPRGERHHWQTKPETRPTGEKNGRAKLTPELVREIRSRFVNENVTKVELGSVYGVSDTVIYNVVTRKSWRNIQ